MTIRIQIASLRDRANLVAELWIDDVQIAEVSREQSRFDVEIYPNKLAIPLDEYLDALRRAKEELLK